MSLYNLIVDGHVHIYPSFDIASAICRGLQNMNRMSDSQEKEFEIIRIWLLTERFDCNFIQQIESSSVQLINKGMAIQQGADGESILVSNANERAPLLFILPGRQIVSRDGLEICALLTTSMIPDRQYGTEEIIERVLESGGVPALNWAPGKWFFSRGTIVKRILEAGKANPLLIGDTSMRPTFWPMPQLMRKAKAAGYKVIAGSDPLPFPGEESNIGTYGFKMKGIFDPLKPASSVRTLLTDPNTEIKLNGRRSGPFSFAKRQSKIMSEKKSRS